MSGHPLIRVLLLVVMCGCDEPGCVEEGCTDYFAIIVRAEEGLAFEEGSYRIFAASSSDTARCVVTIGDSDRVATGCGSRFLSSR